MCEKFENWSIYMISGSWCKDVFVRVNWVDDMMF